MILGVVECICHVILSLLVTDSLCNYDEGKWSECDKLTNVRF